MPSVESALSAFVSTARVPSRDTRASSQGVDTATNREFSSLLDDTAPADNTPPAQPQTTRTGSESRPRREPAASNTVQKRPSNSADTPAELDDATAEPAAVANQEGPVEPTIETAAAPAVPTDATPTADGEAASAQSGTTPDNTAVIAPAVVPVAPPPIPLATTTPTIAPATDGQTTDSGTIDAASPNTAPATAAAAAASAAATAAETPVAAPDAKAAQPTPTPPTASDASAAAAAAAPQMQATANATGKPVAQPNQGKVEQASTDAGSGDDVTEAKTQTNTPKSGIAHQGALANERVKETAPEPVRDQATVQETRTATPVHAGTHAPLESLQPLGANVHTAALSATNMTATQQAAMTVPVSGIAVEIATRAQNGNNQFSIRLDPPELGRIDVRLDVDRHGNVTSHLVVERSETLDLLRRDAPNLERALQDAGLKTGDSALQFSLRDQSAGSDRNARDARLPNLPETVAPTTEPEPIVQAVRSYRWGGTTSGIDIRV